MIPASTALSESRAKWISHAVVRPLPRPGASGNPIATHRDGLADHDPKLLRLQLEAKHGNRCRWTYLEQDPDRWRVRLHRNHR